jgi:hypothetical protein
MSQVELPGQVPPTGNQTAGLPWSSPNVAAAISAFVDRGPFGVAVFDTDLRFILVSDGLAALHGQEASATVGKRIDDVLPPPTATSPPVHFVKPWRRGSPSSTSRPGAPSPIPPPNGRSPRRSTVSTMLPGRLSASSSSSPRPPSSATPNRRPARRPNSSSFSSRSPTPSRGATTWPT